MQQVFYCNDCGKIKKKNQWQRVSSLKDALIDIATKHLLEDDIKCTLIADRKKQKVVCNSKSGSIEFDVRQITCDSCALRNTQYFEGILQIRNPSQVIIEFVNAQCSKAEDEGIFVTKKTEQKNGIDYYMTNQRYLQKLGKMLKDNFSGELKVSKKLFSRSKLTSKEIYRVNVLFRSVALSVGTKVVIRGEEILLKSVGKLVSGKRISDGKRVSYKYSDVVKELS